LVLGFLPLLGCQQIGGGGGGQSASAPPQVTIEAVERLNRDYLQLQAQNQRIVEETQAIARSLRALETLQADNATLDQSVQRQLAELRGTAPPSGGAVDPLGALLQYGLMVIGVVVLGILMKIRRSRLRDLEQWSAAEPTNPTGPQPTTDEHVTPLSLRVGVTTPPPIPPE